MKSDEPDHKKTRTVTSAVCTIARMNPPTPGHAGLIESMIRKAREYSLNDVHIILSGSVDFDNPLEYDAKREVLERMITGIKSKMGIEINVHIDALGKTPLGPIGRIAESTPDIHLIVGEDRKDDYNWLMRYLAAGVTITVDALPRPVGAISATIVRRLARDSVRHGDEHYRELQRIYGDYINTSTLDSVVAQVRERIEIKKTKTKSKGKGRTKRGTKKTRRKYYL